MKSQDAFHLSLPCLNIDETKKFYTTVLGIDIGRSSHYWCDINLYGNQLTFTQSGPYSFSAKNYSFEHTILPSFHFGVLLSKDEWQIMRNKLDGQYEIAPTKFLEKKKGEHESFFIKDPNNYIIEFKCFTNSDDIFIR